MQPHVVYGRLLQRSGAEHRLPAKPEREPGPVEFKAMVELEADWLVWDERSPCGLMVLYAA